MILGAIVLIYADTKTIQDVPWIISSLLMDGIFGLYMLGFVTTTTNIKSGMD